MKAYAEYIDENGFAKDLNYRTVPAIIEDVSEPRTANPGELKDLRYQDITIKDSFSRGNLPSRRVISVETHNLAALVNALGVRKPDMLNGMKVTVLYDLSNGKNNFLGFARPQDKVELKE